MTILKYFSWRIYKRRVKGHSTYNGIHAMHKAEQTKSKNRRKRKKRKKIYYK